MVTVLMWLLFVLRPCEGLRVDPRLDVWLVVVIVMLFQFQTIMLRCTHVYSMHTVCRTANVAA